MKKHTSEEAYYERLRTLGKVKIPSVSETKNNSLGTLIDYKRAADGVAYGIIKENHKYYVKIAGTKSEPNVADFAYIGGLSNITDFQYKSLSEADKQRNMIFNTISEAVTIKPSKTGSKKRLNEDVAGEEIDKATEKINDLDAATAAAEETPAIGAEETGTEELPVSADSEETPSPEETGTEETPSPEETDDEETSASTDSGEEKDITTKEIEKSLGKLTNKLRNTELTDTQVKSYINSFLSAFTDKLSDVDIDDRKEMANKILKVVPEKDIEDLGNDIPQDNDKLEEENCSECGTPFTKYAESRGYTKESIMECGEEEMGSLVSGFANVSSEEEGGDDAETVALFVSLMPKVLDLLKNDYGHTEYAEKLAPMVQSMDESNEDKIIKINELNWGGLKSVGNYLKNKATDAISSGAQQVSQAVSGKVNAVKSTISQLGTEISQNYQKGVKDTAVKELEKIATELGQTLNKLNTAAQKAGEQPININSILMTIKNQVGAKGTADLSKFKSVAEGGVSDAGNIETQPNIKEGEDEENITIDDLDDGSEETKDVTFAPAAQTLGVDTVKPDGAPTTGIDVNVDGQNKSVNIKMNEGKKEKLVSESEQKIRNYIRARLEEKAGLRKPSLNENKKSETLKKLDSVIDKQFALFENMVVNKNNKVNEIFGTEKILGYTAGDIRRGLAKLDPNDANGVNTLFNGAFTSILNNPKYGIIKRIAAVTSPNIKYNILKQYVEQGGGTLRLAPDQKSLQFAPKSVQNAATASQFAGGGTQGGFNAGGTTGVNEIFGTEKILGYTAGDIRRGLAKLNPNDVNGVNTLFNGAFTSILNNPQYGIIKRAAANTPVDVKYNILKQYVEQGGGTLRSADGKTVQFAPKSVQNAATASQFAGGGTQGKTGMGGV